MPSAAFSQPDARHSGVRMAPRVACVQNGDFKSAQERMDAGLSEPYFGMRESVRALSRLFASRTGLIVSLDAGAYRIEREHLTLVSVGHPHAWVKIGRLKEAIRAHAIIAELEAFRPTHVLLRTGGQLGLRIASWCAARHIPTMVLLANAVYGDNAYNERVNRQLMQVLNDPAFVRVGNYKPTACASMVDYGLAPQKAVSFAFDGERQPSALAPKQLGRDASKTAPHIVFAARMVLEKGPLELIEAVRILRQRGIQAVATLYGDGPALDAVRERAKQLPDGAIHTPGQVDNAVLFEALRGATFACVPSRSTFVEGMPMALTEALAARTPVIASNCPVFQRSFVDGEGVRIFQEQDPKRLADVIVDALADDAAYARLSETTADAFKRVSAQHSFTELLEGWG
ncbi:MAG: glycosyltransferase, partial [Polyangiales bacterium]